MSIFSIIRESVANGGLKASAPRVRYNGTLSMLIAESVTEINDIVTDVEVAEAETSEEVLSEALKNPQDLAEGVNNETMTFINESLSTFWQTVKNKVKQFWEAIKKFFSNLFNKIKDMLNFVFMKNAKLVSVYKDKLGEPSDDVKVPGYKIKNLMALRDAATEGTSAYNSAINGVSQNAANKIKTFLNTTNKKDDDDFKAAKEDFAEKREANKIIAEAYNAFMKDYNVSQETELTIAEVKTKMQEAIIGDKSDDVTMSDMGGKDAVIEILEKGNKYIEAIKAADNKVKKTNADTEAEILKTIERLGNEEKNKQNKRYSSVATMYQTYMIAYVNNYAGVMSAFIGTVADAFRKGASQARALFIKTYRKNNKKGITESFEGEVTLGDTEVQINDPDLNQALTETPEDRAEVQEHPEI